MTKLQRAYSVFFSLCLAGTLLFLPGQFFLPDHMTVNVGPVSFAENVYMRLPLYSYLENQATGVIQVADTETSDRITEAGRKSVEQDENEETVPPDEDEDTVLPDEDEETVPPDADEETVPPDADEDTVLPDEDEETVPPDAAVEVLAPDPPVHFSSAKLSNFDYLMNQFYIVDENTSANADQINALRFLEEDLSVKKDASQPQILIYHSHSQEGFADSREGHPEDTVVGVGDYLTRILTETYGYQVIHVTETFDLIDGVLDRSKAYDVARAYITEILEKNPSVQVVIDLHRDGVPEDRRLITEVNGKETARILFFNGLSYTRSQGAVSYLPNPYIQQNLAFSFQLEYLASQYFPGFPRGIYLAGLRYNLHLCPRALLLEAGAQTNTVQEVKNAMEPFAQILDMVLTGAD